MAVSVIANVASVEPTWPARGVAAIPAVSLLLAVEVLVRSGRLARPAGRRGGQGAAVGTRGSLRRSNGSTGRTAGARVAAAMATRPGASVAELARLAGVSRSTVRRHNGHQVPAGGGRAAGGEIG